jgi:NADH dehydrogenase
MAVTDQRGWAAVADGGWYFLLLSVLSLALGLLTVGLVRPWGVVFPRWIPVLGGRPVPARGAAAVAHAGAWIVIVLCGYAVWNINAGNLFTFEPTLGTGVTYPRPGIEVLRWYVPMFAWGPLVIAVATNYYRRRTAAGRRTISPEGGMSVPRVVIVGAGFAGYQAARHLIRRLGDRAEIVLINPTDYFLYLPLLPEVAGGVLDPRRVTVSLTSTLPGVRLILGAVHRIDRDAGTVQYTDPEGSTGTIAYDRLVITAGSVNKVLPVPGIAGHAHGFRSIPEALYLRDHVIRQVELAAATDDPEERAARLTFVVIGAGYTGTEVAATGQLLTRSMLRRHPRLRTAQARWLLLDQAPRILPELHTRLSRAAQRTLSRRGVEVRTGTSVTEAGAAGVRLTTGAFLPTRTVVWTVGVRPDPLVDDLGLATEQARVRVDAFLAVPGHPDIFACGDVAAVPDLTAPGTLTAMTAQHAERQGKAVARNVAASLGHGTRRAYRHHDLGLVVDLGGVKAVAQPFGIPLSGIPAKIATRGYHLLAMPANRFRILLDWIVDAATRRQAVQLGLVRSHAVPLETADPELPRSPVPAGPVAGS